MKGRRMLCQFSTALLDRTASSQAAKSSAHHWLPSGRKISGQWLGLWPQDGSSQPCPADQMHGGLSQAARWLAAAPASSGWTKARPDREVPTGHDGPASFNLFFDADLGATSHTSENKFKSVSSSSCLSLAPRMPLLFKHDNLLKDFEFTSQISRSYLQDIPSVARPCMGHQIGLGIPSQRFFSRRDALGLLFYLWCLFMQRLTARSILPCTFWHSWRTCQTSR